MITYIPPILKNGAYKSENILPKYIACVVFNKALKMIMEKMGVCRMFNSSLRLIGYPPDYLFPQIFSKLSYHKVASRSTSQLVAFSDCL